MRIGKDFDFCGKGKLFYTISLSIFAIGLLVNIIFGVKLDTSFKGGTLIKYSYQGNLNGSQVESAIDDVLGKSVDVTMSTSGGNNVINISLSEALTMDEQATIDTTLNTNYADNSLVKLSSNSLSPTMGKLFFLKCIVAIVLASALLMIYVAFRFRKIGGWSAGAMALVALLHDMLVAYFTFVIFRIPLNDNFVAVELAILGYSLNDTIVIYDRIRENRRIMDKTTPIKDIVNISINESFTRSFNTGFCTFLAIGTVAVLSLIYGLDSITSFALPMMLGVISGCYSTVCICGPLLVTWRSFRAKKEEEKKIALKAASKNKRKK